MNHPLIESIHSTVWQIQVEQGNIFQTSSSFATIVVSNDLKLYQLSLPELWQIVLAGKMSFLLSPKSKHFFQ